MSEEEKQPEDGLAGLLTALSLDCLKVDVFTNSETGAIALIPRTLPEKEWELAAGELTKRQNAERAAMMEEVSLDETPEEDESWHEMVIEAV